MKHIIIIDTHGNPMPEAHGDWVDLFTAEDVEMEAFEYKTISLGVAMQLPEGYYAEMLPRSSTCKHHGILMANSMGIIDNDYNGADDIWRFPALAIRKTSIPKGTRICQFRLVKQQGKVYFVEGDLASNANRGGLGSTGKQ